MLNKTELLEAVKGLNMFNFDRFNKSYSILINPRVLEKGKNGGWQAKLKYICFHFWVHQHLTHLPRAPRKPVAWHSSINTMAPYCSARSQIPFKGATSPSMEKTPSVTTRRIRDDWGGQKQSPADQWRAHQSCQSNQYCNPYLTPTHRIMGLMHHETQMDTLLRSTSVNSESKKMLQVSQMRNIVASVYHYCWHVLSVSGSWLLHLILERGISKSRFTQNSERKFFFSWLNQVIVSFSSAFLWIQFTVL